MSDELDAEQKHAARLMGRCSGIPECCVAYFIDVWIGAGVRKRDEERAHQRALADYIVCPGCADRRALVKTSTCHPTCMCSLALGWLDEDE